MFNNNSNHTINNNRKRMNQRQPPPPYNNMFYTNRDRRANGLMKIMAGLLLCLLLAVVFMAIQLPSLHKNNKKATTTTTTTSTSSVFSPPHPSSSSTLRKNSPPQQQEDQYRIAIIIPFVAQYPESIPSYLNVFCVGAALAQDVADFLIFHNGILGNNDSSSVAECPSNVKFISLQSTLHFASLLLKVVTNYKESSELPAIFHQSSSSSSSVALSATEVLQRVVSRHLELYPYSLVEFKPAYGTIFHDYLQTYSHWGYSDVDLLFGDVSRWIEMDELVHYDIVTYSYGDQHRVYLRGQFTFHKNVEYVNELWRACSYLSDLDVRLAEALIAQKEEEEEKEEENGKDNNHKEKQTKKKKKKYTFESAEGCYSAVVLQHTNLRVKYAVKAWTDVKDHHDTIDSHGLYLSRSLPEANRGVIYKKTMIDSESRQQHNHGRHNNPSSSYQWFEHDSYYRNRTLPLQKPIGELVEIPLPHHSDMNCMYWVQMKYQSTLCLSKTNDKNIITHNDNLYWMDGKLYKQQFETVALSSGYATGPFFHFQEWKRYYRPSQLATLHLHSPISTFVLTKEGAIPLPLPMDDDDDDSSLSSSSTPRRSSWHAFSSSHQHAPPLPQLPSPLQSSSLQQWKTVNNFRDNKWEGRWRRSVLPTTTYCLLSGPRKYPPRPPASDCYGQVSWQDENGIEILSGAPLWSISSVHVALDVTLVMTLQLTEDQSKNREALFDITDLVKGNLQRWQGRPAVVLMHVPAISQETMLYLREMFDERVHAHILDHSLVAVVYQNEEDDISRKALLNMAVDVVPTRWYLSGIELERGLLLSMDTVAFAHRAVRSHQNVTGRVFVVPQFALEVTKETLSSKLNLAELKMEWEEGSLRAPSAMEKGCTSEEIERLDKADALWWAYVESSINSEDTSAEFDWVKIAELTQEMEFEVLNYLTDQHHVKMLTMDESPILLTDNMGPYSGIRTNEIAREIEPLGGSRCYNGLRLAQLAALDYKFDELAGAFAISTDHTRGIASWGFDDGIVGASRCDGCFMLSEHEDVLEDIITDEIRRAGKTAVLWSEIEEAKETR